MLTKQTVPRQAHWLGLPLSTAKTSSLSPLRGGDTLHKELLFISLARLRRSITSLWLSLRQ
jgi:hypothetical protein